jgi:hypothetical protein
MSELCRWCGAERADCKVVGWAGFICRVCVDNNCFKCVDCGRYGKRFSMSHYSHGAVCSQCAENYAYCDFCNRPFRKDDLVKNAETRACMKCHAFLKTCKECKCWFNGEGDLCSGCAPITCKVCGETIKSLESFRGVIGVSNDRICNLCFKRFNDHVDHYEHNYTFKGKAKIFFGVELEFELANCPGEMKAIMNIDFSNNDKMIKMDGSLDHGIELVSMPCSLAYHKKNFGWDILCKSLKDLGCSTEERCGLHVHMSREFTTAQEKRLYWFIYKHIRQVIKIAGREPNDFAEITNDDPSDDGFSDRENERYSVLNFTNDNTIEFRLPKGTLDHKRIYVVLEFLDAAIKYTRGSTLSVIKTATWFSFISWLNAATFRKNKYNNLITFLTARSISASMAAHRDTQRIINANP